MGSCCSAPDVEMAESAQQFSQADVNNNKLVDQKEMLTYVKSHPEMWAMLSVNLGLSEEECQKTANRVAMELASGEGGAAAMKAELTEAQFHTFRSKYMLDGKGSQEFFHRCVFASFVKDGKQYLDANTELDSFLETFYKSGSIFAGDTRLPPKEELKERIMNNGDSGRLSFESFRDIIRGRTSNTQNSKASNNNKQSGEAPSPAPPAASSSSMPAPEETPEPKALAPPSMEFSAHDAPEQTPEVQAVPPPSPGKKKARQRKGAKIDGSAHSTGSGSQTRRKKIDDSAQSTGSGSQTRRKKGRSRSPSERKARSDKRSKSPSQRKKKPTRSKSPTREAEKTKPNSTPEGSAAGDGSKKTPKKKQSSEASGEFSEKRRTTPAKQPQKPKSKRQ